MLLGRAGQWPTSLSVPNDTGSDMRAASELSVKPQANHTVHCEWLHHSSRTVSCIHYMLCFGEGTQDLKALPGSSASLRPNENKVYLLYYTRHDNGNHASRYSWPSLCYFFPLCCFSLFRLLLMGSRLWICVSLQITLFLAFEVPSCCSLLFSLFLPI